MALLLDESRGSAAPAASVIMLALGGCRRGNFRSHFVLRARTAFDVRPLGCSGHRPQGSRATAHDVACSRCPRRPSGLRITAT